MDIEKVVNSKNYKEKIRLYLCENKKNEEKLLKYISSHQFKNDNKLLELYKILYNKNNNYCTEIDFNLVYIHKISNEKLYKWLINIDVKDEITFHHIFEKMTLDNIFCWNITFKELIDSCVNEKKIKVIKRIISIIITKYKYDYIKNINLTKNEFILVLKKLNYIIIAETDKLLQLFIDITIDKKIEKKEFKKYIDIFAYNYPQKIIEKSKIINESEIEIYIKEKANSINIENNTKKDIIDIKGYESRLIIYEKRKNKYMQEIENKGKKKSVLYNFTNHKTIMYGDKITYILPDNNIKEGQFQTLKYSFDIPLEYVLDPLQHNINCKKQLSEKADDNI